MQTVALLDSQRSALKLRAIDWFAYRDVPGSEPEDSLGPMTPGGRPKPVWHALRSLTR